MNNVEIGLRLQKIRKERNMTRGELATAAQISNKFLYEVEMGKKGLSAESIFKISRALSVSSDYILTGESWQKNGELDTYSQKQLDRLDGIMKLVHDFYCDK